MRETLTQLISHGSQDVALEQEGEGGVSITVVEDSIALSTQRYGGAIPSVFLRLLKGRIFRSRKGHDLRVRAIKVQDASSNLSKVLELARDGQAQLVGGYRQSSPVMVISLDQFAEELGHAMRGQSIVDLLPEGRPPLDDPLPLASGRRASKSTVALTD